MPDRDAGEDTPLYEYMPAGPCSDISGTADTPTGNEPGDVDSDRTGKPPAAGKVGTGKEGPSAGTRKPFVKMTDQEISAFKRGQCVYCIYLSSYCGHRGRSTSIPMRTCDYLLRNGHSRWCDPQDCIRLGYFVPKKGREEDEAQDDGFEENRDAEGL